MKKKYKAMVLSCMDPRFQTKVSNYLKRRKFYTTLKGNFNYNAWLNQMAKSGYSGSPQEWKIKIKSQILKHNLTELNTRNAASK